MFFYSFTNLTEKLYCYTIVKQKKKPYLNAQEDIEKWVLKSTQGWFFEFMNTDTTISK